MNKELYVALLQEMTEDEFVRFMRFTPTAQEQVYRLWARQRLDSIRRYRRAGNG